jgi:hypothetical protein
MIIEIQIPDEIAEQYNLDKTVMAKQLVDTVNLDPDPILQPYHFSHEQLSELRRFFGPNIRNADALITLIKRVGTVRLQDAKFELDSDQIESTVEQAYFYAEQGEPTDRSDERFSKADHSKVVQRHVQTVLNDALNYILGLA